MWTSEQATQIQAIAQKARPGIKTYAIPHGLQVEKGPDAIVEHLVENVPKLLEQWVFENFHNYSKRSWIEILCQNNVQYPIPFPHDFAYHPKL